MCAGQVSRDGTRGHVGEGEDGCGWDKSGRLEAMSLGVSQEREHRHALLSVYLLTCTYALRLTATQDNGKCYQPLSWCFTFYAFSVHGTQGVCIYSACFVICEDWGGHWHKRSLTWLPCSEGFLGFWSGGVRSMSVCAPCFFLV